MTTLQRMKYGIACLIVAALAQAQMPGIHAPSGDPRERLKGPRPSNFLRELDSSLEAVVSKVSPAVVQIVVTGYGPLQQHGHETAQIARRHALGSGVIVDPDGYIMTNPM
jgi:S1-C subfamily serine protease